MALVHVDCDLYWSTVTVLDHIGPHLRSGCVVVFDEFHGYDGAELHEARAWGEFVDLVGKIAKLVVVDAEFAGA